MANLVEGVLATGGKVHLTGVCKLAATAPAAEQQSTLESPFCNGELDAETGAVRIIYDNELLRELVSKDSPNRLDEFFV